MNITKNFTLEEFYKSPTATKYKIDNTIPSKYIDNVKALANILQTIRNEWGESIIINSGYRSQALNTKVKGAKNSLHTSGLAADFTAKNKKQNGELFNTVVSLMKLGKIEFRTLIWEYGDSKNPQWLHIDINGDGHSYRHNHIVKIG